MNTNSANSAYEKNEKTVDKYIKAIKKTNGSIIRAIDDINKK